jgi:hypothetical protein
MSRLALGALPSAVPCARAHARAVLHGWGLRTLSPDAEAVVSELVANAVTHGSPAAPSGGVGVVYLCLFAGWLPGAGGFARYIGHGGPGHPHAGQGNLGQGTPGKGRPGQENQGQGRPGQGNPGQGCPPAGGTASVVIEVWDASPLPPVLRRDVPADAESGRGMMLVSELCQAWRCDAVPGWPGKRVRAVLSAG